MAAKDKKIWFPLYAHEWLCDEKIRCLSMMSRGLVVELWSLMWKSDDCTITANTERLARIVNMPHDDFMKCWQEIQEPGEELFIEENGRITSRRLSEESEKAKELTEKRKMAAKVKWDKQEESKCNASAMQVQCIENDLQCHNRTEQNNTEQNKKEAEEEPAATEKTPPGFYEDLKTAYNETVGELFGKEISRITERRKELLRRLFKEGISRPDVIWWRRFLTLQVSESKFLYNWKGYSFDWLLKFENFVKVYEGKYIDGADPVLMEAMAGAHVPP